MMSQAESRLPSTFLLLARELRDQIYDYLLFMRIASPPYPFTATALTQSDRMYNWYWPGQVSPSRGSCFGIFYSCRQVYAELLSSLERHGKKGLNFEIKLSMLYIPLPNPGGWPYMFRSPVWPTWIVLPLCRYPKLQLHTHDSHLSTGNTPPPAVHVNSQCQDLHVSLDVQADSNYRWLDNGGLADLPRALFTMLAKFLLQGPMGLCRPRGASIDMWDIDTLHIDIVGTGSTFCDPVSGSLHTVPHEVVEHAETSLTMHLERLCTSGALSGRVRVVRLAREGEVHREWFVEEGESLSPRAKRDWADNGWVVERDVDIVPMRRLSTSSVLDLRIGSGTGRSGEAAGWRHRTRKLCCVVQ
ncbi:hypothetical protein BDP27DRAFT_1323507 [Rhodocollybia butyracea]|uniref:Uncharacterized protein n=1 Tax=Rhodocollybia butyracea TaxID=206335 RepID=A0A9P5PQZ8_9AGAR|nr:hypothetical protein BDP27DRAFT_1323507 [Rhodocollybia butyracea]